MTDKSRYGQAVLSQFSDTSIQVQPVPPASRLRENQAFLEKWQAEQTYRPSFRMSHAVLSCVLGDS